MSTDTKIALAVAGGGYRATLYALGSLWRLNEFGLLPRLKMITSVSGGSIVTAYLAMHWEALQFDETTHEAVNFKKVIADPIERFCSRGIDVKAGFSGLFSFKDTIGDKVAKAYAKGLYGEYKLEKLPDVGPEFIFYGTNYQTGSSIRFQKDQLFDYKIGRYPNPDITLAKVVGVSSAFPPLLSPVTLKTNPEQWEKTEHASYFDDARLKKKLILCDGGLYDNMGLEAVWKHDSSESYSHVLVCDAGAPYKVKHNIKTNWASQTLRMTSVMTEQQRALRKRTLIRNYKDKKTDGTHNVYGGTYWGIGTGINNYTFDDSMTSDSQATAVLKNIRTRLNAFTKKEQSELINWGYALTDTAMRKWCEKLIQEGQNVKGKWPHPEYPL